MRRHKRETLTIEEATISNMWEITAVVYVLERKGLCTKQDLHDIIAEFRRKNPAPAFLRPPSLSRTSSPRPRTQSSTTS
jgi:hypothetical protein